MTRVDVFLGLTNRAVSVDGRVVVLEGTGGPIEALDGFLERVLKEVPARWTRPSARVWLSGALARPFIFGPVEGLKRWHEVLALAKTRAADATGIVEGCEVTVEDWPALHSTLAVAVGSSLLDALESGAQRVGVRLKSIRPWWAMAAEHLLGARNDGALTAITDPDSLVVLTSQGGRVDAANAYLPRPAGHEADALLARVALTSGIATEAIHRMAFDGTVQAGSAELPFGALQQGAAE